MKKEYNINFIYILLLLVCPANTGAQPQFALSTNVYRTPYENGTAFTVRQDQYTHDPLGRYDLRASGIDDCSSHRIVAAAAGIVRMVVENNNVSCPDCGTSNNYVWIEHANGEWSKYTHFKQNSVTVNEDDIVCAGTILGYECYIGGTTPAQFRHLHFEVRRPNDPTDIDIDPDGGFMSDAAHLIPVMNSFSKHYFEKDDVLTATGSTSCTNTNITVSEQTLAANDIKIYMASGTINTNNNAVIYNNGSDGLLHAGDSISLLPGFNAKAGSSFSARIGNCATTPYPGCN